MFDLNPLGFLHRFGVGDELNGDKRSYTLAPNRWMVVNGLDPRLIELVALWKQGSQVLTLLSELLCLNGLTVTSVVPEGETFYVDLCAKQNNLALCSATPLTISVERKPIVCRAERLLAFMKKSKTHMFKVAAGQELIVWDVPRGLQSEKGGIEGSIQRFVAHLKRSAPEGMSILVDIPGDVEINVACKRFGTRAICLTSKQGLIIKTHAPLDTLEATPRCVFANLIEQGIFNWKLSPGQALGLLFSADEARQILQSENQENALVTALDRHLPSGWSADYAIQICRHEVHDTGMHVLHVGPVAIELFRGHRQLLRLLCNPGRHSLWPLGSIMFSPSFVPEVRRWGMVDRQCFYEARELVMLMMNDVLFEIGLSVDSSDIEQINLKLTKRAGLPSVDFLGINDSVTIVDKYRLPAERLFRRLKETEQTFVLEPGQQLILMFETEESLERVLAAKNFFQGLVEEFMPPKRPTHLMRIRGKLGLRTEQIDERWLGYSYQLVLEAREQFTLSATPLQDG